MKPEDKEVLIKLQNHILKCPGLEDYLLDGFLIEEKDMKGMDIRGYNITLSIYPNRREE